MCSVSVQPEQIDHRHEDRDRAQPSLALPERSKPLAARSLREPVVRFHYTLPDMSANTAGPMMMRRRSACAYGVRDRYPLPRFSEEPATIPACGAPFEYKCDVAD
jgi:hypothetical protein